MTPKEIFLEMLKPDGQPERQLKQYEAFYFAHNNPITAFMRGGRVKGEPFVDRWGVYFLNPIDAPGAVPHHTEENKVLKDITRWRDYVKAPDLIGNCSEGWEEARKSAEEARANGKLVIILMGTGMFEQCHFLMGFEDTLTNLYEHPKEMHELIDYIYGHRMEYLKLLIDNLHPDAILSHDDWGAKDSLFMQPDLWREFYKEPYRKFYKYMRDNDVIAIHHADSYLVPIIEDMVEIGIQCWQGVLPENNIPKLQEQLKGRMVLMGGIGAAIDRADSTEEEIHDYVLSTLKENCPRGHYLPCITYGAPGTVFTHVDPIIDSTIDEYNSQPHIKSYRPATPVRRELDGDTNHVSHVQEVETDHMTDMEKLALAIYKGQKAKTVKLCEELLNQGIPATEILSQGLLKGMSTLGEDFSANRVFVPEMLMAAKCMTQATEILKPYLISGDGSSTGKVCLGTVKGDMHDIGKNLVKIMLEGNGLEVIDLGVDVSAENFVQTAITENCNMIACSALLTTTMSEMKKVVELATKEGIRENVKIMIGGAPITQKFCDEIGADLYSEDASTAAKSAAEVLR